MESVLVIVVIFTSFVFSAAAGLGGSLLLVPALALIYGPKQGIALAALLLAANNAAKVIAYRKTIPLRKSLLILAFSTVGAWVGASLMVMVPVVWVHYALYGCVILTIVLERYPVESLQRASSWSMATLSGAASGFSGTSGPLKGLAVRNIGLDRMNFVGACSVISLAGDVMKTMLYTRAQLIESTTWPVIYMSLPLIPFTAVIGRRLNREFGERGYAGLFWCIMGGYTLRILIN